MKIILLVIAATSLLALLAFRFRKPATKFVFDIPALKGKNIAHVQAVLGKPESETIPTEQQANAGVTGDKIFSKSGYSLDVQYNPKTKKVIDFFLSQSNSVSNYHLLEQAGNLTSSSGFSIKPVKENRDQSKYTGIIITAE